MWNLPEICIDFNATLSVIYPSSPVPLSGVL